MPNYKPAERERRQDVQNQAGQFDPTKPKQSQGLLNLIHDMRRSYVEDDIQIVEGLTWNQRKLLNNIHYYLLSKFESGQTDENGNERYFHNIINSRNAHASKNIDLDTKDILLTADSESGWFFSFILRNEIRSWMDKSGFASLLNDLSENLPKFGKVIWEKCYDEDGNIKIKEVDIRDCIFDPSAKTIYPKDSGAFLKRTILAPWEIMEKVEYGNWDRDSAIALINAAPIKQDKFISSNGSGSFASTTYSMTDTIPSIDVYDCWGFFPASDLRAAGCKMNGEEDMEDGKDGMETPEYLYAHAVIGGIESGAKEGNILFAELAEMEDFPFKECNWHRKIAGRSLPISNSELLIDLQARMNELINRFFSALRMGSLHLFQTRGMTGLSNLLQDAQDGDIFEVKSEITPIPTELRAFQQYAVEVQNIEAQADRICNTVEVVTGEALPTNTPFRLGAQLTVSAQKIFDKVREDCGIFITEVFTDWILPEIISELSEEHVLELVGSVDELRTFDEMYRKYLLAQSVKDYVLQIGRLPADEELKMVEQTLADELKNADRKVKIEKKYFTLEKIKSMRLSFDVTDERKNFNAQSETMSNLLQIIASNPAIMQDETAKKIIGSILEAKGISPIQFASLLSKPVDPMMGAGAAAPAAKAFSENPGDANNGLNTESVSKGLERAAA